MTVREREREREVVAIYETTIISVRRNIEKKLRKKRNCHRIHNNNNHIDQKKHRKEITKLQ